MIPKSGETLLSQPDMTRIHRRVVLVGAVAAWFAAAVFLVAGFFSNESILYIQAVGPILAAGLMTSLIVLHRENGGIALLGSAIVVTVMYAVIPRQGMLMPAALALVIISALGMIFVTRRIALVTATTAIGVMLTPKIWGLSPTDSVQMGSLMMLSFVMTTVIFLTIRNAAATLNTKFKVMFEDSPSALMEEDWSRSIDLIRSRYVGHPAGIRGFLAEEPELVREAVSRAVVTRVNSAALDLLEASVPDDVLGRRDGRVVTAESLDGFVEILASQLEGAEVFEAEFDTRTFRSHRRVLHARCVSNPAATGPNGVLVAIADVTPERAREEALADLVRAKDEFIASISHELRTPLTAVVGLTSEMSSSEMSGAEISDLLGLVSEQAVEMVHIVEDLLVAARAEMGLISLSLGEVDLGGELAAVAEAAKAGLLERPEGLPLAFADRGRVRQILRNLVTNVERYGGLERRVLGGEDAGVVWIEVRDNGDGVSAEDADRIFQPYATAHTGVSGSVGLGLSVARQLAELMGGTLTYRRDQGESVFRLELPLSRTAVGV